MPTGAFSFEGLASLAQGEVRERRGEDHLGLDWKPENAMNINAIVKDNVVRFVKYKQGELIYRVRVPGELLDRTFPVSITEVGHSTLPATDKAESFMHFIVKAIEDGTFVRQTEVH